jgi:hypothetical protein
VAWRTSLCGCNSIIHSQACARLLGAQPCRVGPGTLCPCCRCSAGAAVRHRASQRLAHRRRKPCGLQRLKFQQHPRGPGGDSSHRQHPQAELWLDQARRETPFSAYSASFCRTCVRGQTASHSVLAHHSTSPRRLPSTNSLDIKHTRVAKRDYTSHLIHLRHLRGLWIRAQR